LDLSPSLSSNLTPESAVWWTEAPQRELWQGDIIADLPFWTITRETVFLEKRTVATRSEGSKEFLVDCEAPKQDSQGFFRFLGRARYAPGIILTHDCELDKNRKTRRLQVVRLGDVEDLSTEERHKVMNQASYSKLVLPEVPTLDRTMFVDFQIQITLDTRLVESKPKLASLSEFGRRRLRVGLLYYFLRKAPPEEFVATSSS
jgi:hypothetical protein